MLMLALAQEDELLAFHKRSDLQAIHIHAARQIMRLPMHALLACRALLMHERRHFFAEQVVDFESDEARAR